MTIFEKIKAMDINEFSEWFEENCMHDDDPCIKWWDETYCNNCEPELVKDLNSDRMFECCWCESYGKCKFFQDMNKVPDNKQTIKMWLESESN